MLYRPFSCQPLLGRAAHAQTLRARDSQSTFIKFFSRNECILYDKISRPNLGLYPHDPDPHPRPMMQSATHEVASDLIFQSVGLSSGWITATPIDPAEGALHQTLRWAEYQFASIPNPSFQKPAVHLSDTHRAIEKARQQAYSLFASEGIHAQFSNPTTQQISGVLALQRKDRLANTLPLDFMEPNTKSLYLLEMLSKTNPKRSRSLTINDMLRLAIHTGSSITDFCPDSHVLISNLASFLIRFHLQHDIPSLKDRESNDIPCNKSPRLQDTWDAVGRMYPRVSPKVLGQQKASQLHRHLVMFLYGVYVLKYGQVVPATPVRAQDIQDRVRALLNQGVAFWPRRLSDLLNESWINGFDQEETLDHFAEDIALLARRVGRCLLGQYPLVSDFVG